MTNKEISKYFSFGNLKLKSNDKIKFLIWNLPAQDTCPNATELCKKFCYAKKSERCYPTCKASRQRHLDFSKTDEFIPTITDAIVSYANKHKNALIVVRIHESGDFYNLPYFEKWYDITLRVSEICKNVRFLSYTKSFKIVKFASCGLLKDFTEDLQKYNKWVIRASVDDSTSKEYLKLIKLLGLPIYYSSNDACYFEECRCADCGTCLQCLTNKNLRCRIH